jgi:LPXTG-motif cell wall-anchored protein
MNTRRAGTGLAALALTGLSVFGLQAPVHAQYVTDPTAEESVSDSTVEPGQELTASTAAGSFPPGSEVEVGVESTYQRVGTTTAAANGSARFTFEVPRNLEPGEHNVVFTGSGNTERVPFTVVGASGGAGTGSATDTVAGQLPRTGTNDFVPLTVAGAGLVLVGTGVVVAARRRRTDGPFVAA